MGSFRALAINEKLPAADKTTFGVKREQFLLLDVPASPCPRAWSCFGLRMGGTSVGQGQAARAPSASTYL